MFILAAELGAYMAKKGLVLVFGGYGQGLMGLVADGATSEGGHVIGVTIPKFTGVCVCVCVFVCVYVCVCTLMLFSSVFE